MKYEYSENVLVQDSAAALMKDELGWEVVYAYNKEILGENGTLGRKSYHEIVLWRYFSAALKRLNPWITDAQLVEARQILNSYLSSESLLQINEEKYFLIRDGIPVTVKKPSGKNETRKAKVIDYNDPGNNHFLAVKELKIHGDTYRRRTDIVGFVNGLPLLFVELKRAQRCGRGECLHRKLYRLPGYHSVPVLLQRVPDAIQRHGSQGRDAWQQVRVLPRVEAPVRSGRGKRRAGDHAPRHLPEGELPGSL